MSYTSKSHTFKSFQWAGMGKKCVRVGNLFSSNLNLVHEKFRLFVQERVKEVWPQSKESEEDRNDDKEDNNILAMIIMII